jgi:hypothetical protein
MLMRLTHLECNSQEISIMSPELIEDLFMVRYKKRNLSYVIQTPDEYCSWTTTKGAGVMRRKLPYHYI